MKRVLKLVARASLCLAALVPVLAAAQASPGVPVRWIVPYPAGGGADVVARIISHEMQKALGQPLVIDNRPGGGTRIGMGVLAAAPADGYTMATADVATLAFNPALYSRLPYDPRGSFAYVGGLARTPFVLAVRQGLGVNSVKELIELARSQPGRLSYASAGPGSPHHIAMEMLQQRAQVRLNHIPYKGGAPALQDLMAGQVDVMMLDLPGLLANKGTRRFRTLGVALPARHALLPEVPTLDEAGLAGVVAYSWQVLLVRADTSRQAVDSLARALASAVAQPAVRERLSNAGADLLPLTPAQAAELVEAEIRKWTPVIRAANIQLD